MKIQEKITLKPPPFFSEETLKKIVHYTDLEANPIFDAFKSKAIFEIHSGAKGVSKSFSRMIITIYRIVNDIRFNSCWCRNIYSHMITTLVPNLKKCLDLLANCLKFRLSTIFSYYKFGRLLTVWWWGFKSWYLLFKLTKHSVFSRINITKKSFFIWWISNWWTNRRH